MTVGWIFEGDRDRFLAAQDRMPPSKPTRPKFLCPFCSEVFANRDQLRIHLQRGHVVQRPFLLIEGAEPGAEDVIRGRVDPRSLELCNCSELAAGFDGGPVEAIQKAALARKLTGLRRATVRLRLLNAGDGLMQPVVQEYHLRIIIPDIASLARADKLFVAQLGIGGVDLNGVSSFYEATRDGAAAEYAEALADYVRGVLLKDGDPRTGVSGRLHHYHDIQTRALSTLQSFDRPLANLLSAIVRFSLNNFSRWEETTGFAGLDRAYSMLGPIASGALVRRERGAAASDNNVGRVFVCPVDIGTDTVARLSEQASQLSRWGTAAEEQFSTLTDLAKMDSLDRAKIRALWAVTALRLRATASAERALRLLDGDPTFGRWANTQLAKADS